jgi:hypothetical protein
MCEGINRCGDRAFVQDLHGPAKADVGVMYGWKMNAYLARHPQYVYADLGFFVRETHYRICVGGWSPHEYVRAGLPDTRFKSYGLEVKPWRKSGENIVIAGASGKSAATHGVRHNEWERLMSKRLQDIGRPIVFRPKQTDPYKSPIGGTIYDEGPLDRTLANAWALVTHHSNTAIDALIAGVPVYCETGAGAAFSCGIDEIADPPLPEGREQFLADVAWLNWTLDEMRSGECWAHLKDRGLIKC